MVESVDIFLYPFLKVGTKNKSIFLVDIDRDRGDPIQDTEREKKIYLDQRNSTKQCIANTNRTYIYLNGLPFLQTRKCDKKPRSMPKSIKIMATGRHELETMEVVHSKGIGIDHVISHKKKMKKKKR